MTRLSISVGAFMLGCGLMPAFGGAGAATETTVHALGKGKDGAQSYTGLVDIGGALYGTSFSGGAYGKGTVFKIAANGTETVLHSFGGISSDGTNPRGALVALGGALYGTTTAGGKNGKGTVFKITTAGGETVLHAFAGQPKDGATPDATLLVVGGALYGTTENGGTKDLGKVFSVSTGGGVKVMYSFGTKANNADGIYPEAALSLINGKIYGTTFKGGANCTGQQGCGTIFSMAPGGTSIVTLHKFGGQALGDGAAPQAGITIANGVLYGTTSIGGSGLYAAGTVYTLSGSTEKVLHTFVAYPLGAGYAPAAPLTLFNGTLYGTTTAGGAYQYGTVFEITPKGAVTTLHAFNSQTEGALPFGTLIGVGNALYGTNSVGGPYKFGTVFKLVP